MPLGVPTARKLHHRIPSQSLGTGQHHACCLQRRPADARVGAGRVTRSLRHPGAGAPSGADSRTRRQRSPHGDSSWEPGHRHDSTDPQRSTARSPEEQEPGVLGPGTQHPTRPWPQTPAPAWPWGSAGKSGSKCTFLFPAGC